MAAQDWRTRRACTCCMQHALPPAPALQGSALQPPTWMVEWEMPMPRQYMVTSCSTAVASASGLMLMCAHSSGMPAGHSSGVAGIAGW